MNTLPFPFLLAAVLVAFAGALPVGVSIRRVFAASAAALSALLIGASMMTVAVAAEVGGAADPVAGFLRIDAIDGWLMLVLTLIALMMVWAAPVRDVADGVVSGTMFLCGANLLAHASPGLSGMAVGWALTAVPFVVGRRAMSGAGRAWMIPLLASSAAFLVPMMAMVRGATPESGLSPVVWVSVVLAVVLRKGLFPFHGWVVKMFEEVPVAWLAVAFNGRLGSLLLIRLESNSHGLPEWVVDAVSVAIILSAVVCSLRALVETNPRRLFGYLFIGQSALVTGGVVVANTESFTGSLVHWVMVAASSSGLLLILRLLEVRMGPLTGVERPGLAVGAPRLSAMFLMFALALAGLPGTLGYCSQDLVLNGATEHSFPMGLALALTSALNALCVFRVFTHLFLGVNLKKALVIPDLLARERWPLAICLLFLLGSGLFPRSVVQWKSSPAIHDRPAHRTGGHH